MFGISGTELFIIAVFALLVFGPDKLPQFGRTVGRVMSEFKRAQENMESVIRAEMYTGDKDKEASGPKMAPSTGEPDIVDDDEEEEDEE